MAQRRVFVDSEGNQYGIDQVSYDVATGEYSVPGSGTPVTRTNAPNSFQAQFVQNYTETSGKFISDTTVDAPTQVEPAPDVKTPQSRPERAGLVDGADRPTQQPSTSAYARGDSVPPIMQARFDQATDNNGLTQAQHTPTKLTDKDGNPLPDDQEDPKNVQVSEPLPPFNPQYPYNRVTETESGHVFELDDTPGSERVSITHRSGSFIEMHPDGKRVDKTLNDRHEYTNGKRVERVKGETFKIYDKSVTIKTTEGTVTFQLESGSMNITLNSGNLNLHIAGGNLNMKVNGNLTEEITGNVLRKVGGNVQEIVSGNVERIISGTSTDTVSGAVTVTGATINLN